MKKLRSHEWFVRQDKMGFMYRSWIKNQGWPHDLFNGRPVIGICNTWSELTPCNAHFREIADWVKKGVWEAGGFPLEFPVMSLGEVLLRPTAMLFRNLASMDVEESIRGNPLDGVVLLMGCDKTTPSLLMGAASCDLPTIGLSGGPMLSGKFRGHDLGSGTGVWQMSEQVRSGEMQLEEFFEAESCMHRSKGHCMTMGTASTMASMVESLGMALPGNAAIPAVDARRYTLAQLTGRRIVEMVKEDLRMSQILTRKAFENAIRANAAIGGSTNAVIHLLAIAGRMGVPLKLDDFDQLGSEMPCLVNLQPSGTYLMEDFFYAGGVPAVLRELGEADALHRDALTVNGQAIWKNVAEAPCWNRDVIRKFAEPFKEKAGIAVLRGNLAPDGAVIKPSAASPHLLRHRGRAVVFENIEDFHTRIDDETLDIDENCVMILKNCGPKGYPGMAEVGNMALPPKVLRKGVRDMVRISDARMSGTAYGTVVLHTSPEAAAGGAIALAKSGDLVTLDVPGRTVRLDVEDSVLAARRAEWKAAPLPERGWLRLYVKHVQQACEGADLDFLVGKNGAPVARDNH
ncbi:MAG TPA: IlvD/Edd family dehydratase [Candidatus Eisenbacteria bacterium]|jgi:dihydroxy-acid dehydratase|nr:IlvD/Edd family dehydratase [Candidatus Eisenbacteria bacterium]